MKFIGNLLWFFIEGIAMFFGWALAGLIMCVTIIGIPVGIQCFKIAGFVLFPFGKSVDYKDGMGKFLLNLLWIIFFGWELALSAAIIGVVWCVSIIGIPFGIQSFKIAKLAFMPFGTEITKK